VRDTPDLGSYPLDVEQTPQACARILALSLVALGSGGCGEQATEGEAPPALEVSVLEEFQEVERGLRAGHNSYIGVARLGELRGLLRAAPRSVQEAIGLRMSFSIEALRHGRVEEALARIEEAVSLAEEAGASPAMLAPLWRARAIANLRVAEVENCIQRHNADCCIYPLAGGGVHAVDGAARRAAADYGALLELDPEDLSARWLYNLCHQALGDWPDAVPPAWLVPPAAFVSEHEIGRFRDIAGELGVDAYNLCGGSVVEDFDGDGDLDIATSTFDVGGGLTMYRNEGGGVFSDVSLEAGTSGQLGGLNLVAGDYDSDGDVDLLVLRGAWLLDDGCIRNSLLENDGSGKFTDVTRAAGLALPAAPTQVACWGDYDLDGDLDLFVGNESRKRTRGDGDYPSQLWRNNGDGSFTDVAMEAGVRNNAFAKGACWGDYDNDGDLDLYISNIQSNRLLQNQGDGTFRGVARAAGVALRHRTFATWFFDYDNDGWLDLFVASYDATLSDVCADHLGLEFTAHPPALFRNRGDGSFEDVATTHGLNHAWLPMGANFGDLDNDGWLDIYLATGDPQYETLVPNVMLRNDEGRGFQNVTTSGGFGHLQKGHGVSFADIDSDGDQDIYHQLGGFYPGDAFRNALFENPGHGNRFLTLELRGVKSHRSGSGARVEVRISERGGERSIHRAPGCVSSFGGSPARVEMGLGKAERILWMQITWPVSGETDRYEEVPMDARVRATEGAAELERL
jgi:hypothetical protein